MPPIYDNPVRSLIPDMIAALAQPGQVFSKNDAVEWFAKRYPKIKLGTISAHLIRFSTNARGRLHHNVLPDEDLLYQVDGSHFRTYDPSKDPTPIHSQEDAERRTRSSPRNSRRLEEVREFGLRKRPS